MPADLLEKMFPPFGLRLTCGPLAMRCVRESDFPVIVGGVKEHGIYDGGRPMPFVVPWPDELGEHGLRTTQFYWRNYADWSPAKWHLPLLVEHEGEFVGIQDMLTPTPFLQTRSIETGSWLFRHRQDRGIGTLMRQAVCAFAFDHLGAQEMCSAAMEGNERSLGVSRKVGYRTNGSRRIPGHDGQGWRNELLVVLAPQTFVRPGHPVLATGVDAFRRSIGLDADGA